MPHAGEERVEEDNALSPEACYECKINGHSKRGTRRRRDANGTLAAEVRAVRETLEHCFIHVLSLLLLK